MVLLEYQKEVILKKLLIILQYLSCIFKHLLEVILMLVQKLNETVVAQLPHLNFPLVDTVSNLKGNLLV